MFLSLNTILIPICHVEAVQDDISAKTVFVFRVWDAKDVSEDLIVDDGPPPPVPTEVEGAATEGKRTYYIVHL